MKRLFLTAARTTAAVLTAVLLTAAGCGRQSAVREAAGSDAEAAGTEDDRAEAAGAQDTEIPATITYQGLWMRESLEGSGIRQLEVGERVTITGEKEPDPSNTDRLYVPIRLDDGSEGWVSQWYAIPDTVPGVLTQEAKIYSEAKLTKLTDNTPLTAMTVLAVGDEGEQNGFFRVSYTNSEGYARIDEYVKTDFISLNETDVLAAHLFNLAEAAEDESIRAEYLDSASSLGSPAFGMFIDQAAEVVVEETPNDLTVSTLVVISDSASVHESPDASTPVQRVHEKNEILGVVGRSTTKRTENGVEDWWYELEGGGWIFGDYVDELGMR